jgi:hypothetical protein
MLRHFSFVAIFSAEVPGSELVSGGLPPKLGISKKRNRKSEVIRRDIRRGDLTIGVRFGRLWPEQETNRQKYPLDLTAEVRPPQPPHVVTWQGGEVKKGVLAVLILLASSVFAGELLVNGDFETGVLSPWYSARNFCSGTCIPWNVSTANPHTGTYSAMDEGNIELRQDFTPTLGSNITNVSFWSYTDSGVNAVDFFYTDSSDEEFVVFSNPNTWTLQNVTSDVNAGKTLMGFSIWGSGPDHISYVDDASITSNGVPEPGTLVMLGSGVLAAAAGLRRKLGI